MPNSRGEAPAERSARRAAECRESHKKMLENAKTCEPKMSRYWTKLARLTELNAERHDECAKDDAELDRLLELRRVRPHDESIQAEIENRPNKKRANAILMEIVRVSKWKVI